MYNLNCSKFSNLLVEHEMIIHRSFWTCCWGTANRLNLLSWLVENFCTCHFAVYGANFIFFLLLSFYLFIYIHMYSCNYFSMNLLILGALFFFIHVAPSCLPKWGDFFSVQMWNGRKTSHSFHLNCLIVYLYDWIYIVGLIVFFLEFCFV